MFVILKVNFKSKIFDHLQRNLDIHRYCLKFESNKNIKPLNATVLLAVISDHGSARLYSISFNFSISIKKFALQIYVESTSKFACADQLKSLSKHSLSQFRLKSRVYQPHRLIHAKQIYFKVNIFTIFPYLTFSHI